MLPYLSSVFQTCIKSTCWTQWSSSGSSECSSNSSCKILGKEGLKNILNQGSFPSFHPTLCFCFSCHTLCHMFLKAVSPYCVKLKNYIPAMSYDNCKSKENITFKWLDNCSIGGWLQYLDAVQLKLQVFTKADEVNPTRDFKTCQRRRGVGAKNNVGLCDRQVWFMHQQARKGLVPHFCPLFLTENLSKSNQYMVHER